MSQSSGRRDFLKNILLAGGLLWTGSKLNRLFAADAVKSGGVPEGKTALSEKDGTASQLGYRHDATKVDLKKYPQRKTAEGKKQFCGNCMFFTAENAQWGKCQVLQGGLVNAKGWCMSWAKKA